MLESGNTLGGKKFEAYPQNRILMALMDSFQVLKFPMSNHILFIRNFTRGNRPSSINQDSNLAPRLGE